MLIVDDEQEIISLVSSYFQRQGGFDISTASDGITAMIEVGRLKPDLLILDIKIPGVDGVEVCRCIKADATNKTAIIAISGANENEQKILQAGADAFMAKPIELDRLYAEARRLLRVL